MDRLSGAHELLDGPLDPAVLAGNLRDLARVNRLLGGSALSWKAIEPYVRDARAPMRLLDVGTGAADIPRSLAERMRRARPAGRRLEIVATDVRPEIVDLAREAAEARPEITITVAAADAIAEPDRSFDIVHASLVLHHLEPTEAVNLLAEMQRVARTAVIINDLDRRRRWLTGTWLLTRLATRNRYTRHDAPLSVRRAYRPTEVVEMAARVGLSEVRRYWAWPRYRYALVFEPRS